MQELQNRSDALNDIQKNKQQQQQQQLQQQQEDENVKKKLPDPVWKGTTTVSTVTSMTLSKVNQDGIRLFPVPAAHKDCNLQGKKDALSAIDRATTPECKQLLQNITCMQKAGFLYDTSLRRECKVENPGRTFRAVPLGEEGARIVFLLSLHGRAFRQVKRLFKAIYHRDHYYFIHVDSVSLYLMPNLSIRLWYVNRNLKHHICMYITYIVHVCE